MKTFRNIIGATFIAISFSACSTADIDILAQNNIEEQLIAAPWTVNYYLNNNVEETNDFEGYVVTFKEKGVLVAKKGFNEFSGRWFEDKVTKEVKIIFDAAATPFDKISESWKLQTKEGKQFFFVNVDETEQLKIQQP